jgi:hypothetical protein
MLKLKDASAVDASLQSRAVMWSRVRQKLYFVGDAAAPHLSPGRRPHGPVGPHTLHDACDTTLQTLSSGLVSIVMTIVARTARAADSTMSSRWVMAAAKTTLAVKPLL